MSDKDDSDSLSEAKAIDRFCDAFEAQWLEGKRPEIEAYLENVPESIRKNLLLQLIELDIEYRKRIDDSRTAQEYVVRFPEFSLASMVAMFEKTQDIDIAGHARKLEDETQIVQSLQNRLGRDDSNKRIHYFGDYVLIEKTARGGMGTVYRARQISLNRIVAIKMINSGQFASKQEVQRFYSEAEAAASLDHPNIVPVYEVGQFEGDHFFSMAFVEGSSLASMLVNGPMKPREAALLIRTVAQAVQFAHEQGVIHRDLKPSNILLDNEGRPRVTDFGLAKRITDETGITVSGDVLGTPSFMPPEQAAGKIDVVGVRSDVYSLGAVLYTCLSGRPPFQSSSHLETLRQVIDSEPVALRQLNSMIPRDLETITHKCLEKSVARRYESAKTLAEDLDRFLSGTPIAARPISAIERTFRWSKRHPAHVLNIAGFILVLVGATGGWYLVRSREREMASQENAQSLIEQLNIASVAELPNIVQQVRDESRTTKLLREQYQSTSSGTALHYRAAMGLLPVDESVLSDVCQAWTHAEWTEWNWLREQLRPHRDAVRRWFANVNPKSLSEMDDPQYVRYFAIAAIVAEDRFDTNSTVQDPVQSIQSERFASTILDELQRDPTQLLAIVQAIYPLRMELGPFLAKRMDYTRTDESFDASIAATLISELFQREPSRLFGYGWKARSELFSILFGNPKNAGLLRTEMRLFLNVPVQGETWDELNAYDRRRALAATILYSLEDFEFAWPLLCHHENPTVRSLMIDWLPKIQRNPANVLHKLESLLQKRSQHIEQMELELATKVVVPNPWLIDAETSLLRGVIQILGNYPPAQTARLVDESFWKKIDERYEFDPDPGIHASCEWLLRRMERSSIEEIDARLKEQRVQRKGWLVNSNGHTMAIVHGPIEYIAGADSKDPDREAGTNIDPVDGSKEIWSGDHQHPKRIQRSFAISLHETRLQQVHPFDDRFHALHNKTLGPTLEHPACRVSWNKAAAYCNWLSKNEDIPEDQWCFVSDAQGNADMQLAPNYLHRTGYRLPTEAEWEYVCRAGTTTRRYFGETDELLSQYVWYMYNSREKILSLPGRLKPNELGLFDTLGNVSEWCLDEFDIRRPGMRLKEADIEGPLDSQLDRILRGSSLYSMNERIRAAEYYNFPPSYRDGNTGFRIARTITE